MQVNHLSDWLNQNPFGVTITSEIIRQELSSNATWEQLFRSLVQYSKQLPTFSDSMKAEAQEIKGCENQVWFMHQQVGSQFFFALDSNARITKGILGIILAFFQGKKREEINQESLQHYLQDTGLTPFLSPSRNHGVNAIVDRIFQTIKQ